MTDFMTRLALVGAADMRTSSASTWTGCYSPSEQISVRRSGSTRGDQHLLASADDGYPNAVMGWHEHCIGAQSLV